MPKSHNPTNRLSQFDSILSENRRLSRGGLPRSLAPVTFLIGRYPWQSLAAISLIITGFLFLTHPLGFIHSVKIILLSP